jgi:hypothetical protein
MVMPMFFAVPSTILTADSSFVAFVSGILIFAISSTCATVTFPTTSVLARPDVTPAAFLSRMLVGDVLRMNVNERSCVCRWGECVWAS